MNTAYSEAFAALNSRQKQAVEHIEGPVLVVAGPGTGKTQLLGLRVAQILQQTDTDASNILCLTFTNAAATNMRERLLQFIGPDAHKVVIRTFHSFAAEVMSLYPDYFWNGAKLTVAPDALQAGLVQKILSELPLDNQLAIKFAGKYTALKDVQDALKLTKEAGLSPAKLAAMLDVNDAYIELIEPSLVEILSAPLSYKNLSQLGELVDALPDQDISQAVAPLTSLSDVIKSSLHQAITADELLGKTTNTGIWKKRWVQTVQGTKAMHDERKRSLWWRSLVEVYEVYRAQLHARGYYDYSDMIIEVITMLETNPELLSAVQERFLYVLLDEFQDTNKAQLRLADLVADHPSAEGKPNLMAVGDDDQSIFAFNGAELNNMLSFRRSYPATTIIVLEENYRSSQAILDASAQVIEQAKDRLVLREPGLTKQLRAQRQPTSSVVEHSRFATREHQLSSVAQAIQQRWQQSPNQTIAVLAGGHAALRQISALLSALQVPVSYERRRDVFESEIIQLILLIAETVIAVGEGDQKLTNHNLARVLQHPVWKLEPLVLWKLAVRQRQQADWLEALADHSDPRLSGLANWLLWLAGEASYQPLGVMLEYLIGLRPGQALTSPIREYYLATRAVDSQYLQTLSAVQLLLSLSTEFAEQPTATLSDLIRFSQLNRDLQRPISDSSWFVSGDHAVELMTVYKAKGLEFDEVYILDAIESSWQPRRGGRKPPANLPLQPYGEIYDDYVRLMYVAMTRAKHAIHISSFTHDAIGQEVLPTPLIEAIAAEVVEPTEDPIELLEQNLRWPELDNASELQLLQPVLDDYSLSATGLLHFLDVTSGGPQRFLETDILRVPSLSTASMGFGNAIHRALQFAQMTRPAPDLTDIIDAYRGSLREQRLSDNDISRYLMHGEQVLQSLFVDKGFMLPADGQAEVAIHNVMLGEVRLGGKIDHLVTSQDRLLITDYKTGTPLTNFETRDKNKVVKAWKHRTQLTFYALLCQTSGRSSSLSTLQTRMLYVEADSARALSLSFTPTQADIDRLTSLVKAVWSRITTLNLPDVINYSADIDGITQFENDLINGVV
ncbi:MAG: ATP-dependent DNA helicase [Candidatus Saccharimonadales bacterium]